MARSGECLEIDIQLTSAFFLNKEERRETSPGHESFKTVYLSFE